MSIFTTPPTVRSADLHDFRDNWGWFLATGIVLIAMGTLAIGYSAVFTFTTMIFFGCLLMIGGIAQLVDAFWARRWSGFFFDLLAGALYIVLGLMIVANPGASAEVLTLMIAAFAIAEGVFRIVAALLHHTPHRLWLLLNGALSVAIGILIWAQWPFSGLWVIGLLLGIDMLFNGWSLVMLALAVRSLGSSKGGLRAEGLV